MLFGHLHSSVTGARLLSLRLIQDQLFLKSVLEKSLQNDYFVLKKNFYGNRQRSLKIHSGMSIPVALHPLSWVRFGLDQQAITYVPKLRGGWCGKMFNMQQTAHSASFVIPKFLSLEACIGCCQKSVGLSPVLILESVCFSGRSRYAIRDVI